MNELNSTQVTRNINLTYVEDKTQSILSLDSALALTSSRVTNHQALDIVSLGL
jgi:hypothetical protein